MTMSDHEAFEAIRAHHRQLVSTVTERVLALDDAVSTGQVYEITRARLVNFLVEEVLTHAAAEEQTIYPAAAKNAALAETVVAMVAEHRALAGAVESLAGASNGGDAVRIAQSLAALFAAHVAAENEVLLPPLVLDESVVVATLLAEMSKLTAAQVESIDVDPTPETKDHEAVVLSQLVKAATALARAGQGDEACALVAGTWAALREPRPDLAERVNRALHRLVRLVGQEAVTITSKRAADDEGSDPLLDVRTMAPAQRHEIIFRSYQDLGDGEAFVLVNDHDPKPLQYQFEAEHAGEFTWDYAQRGPTVWRVRIGRVSA